MSKRAQNSGLLNRAVLWHLQLSLRLLDRLGYHMTAVNVAAAIDALTNEAEADAEISKMDFDHGDRAEFLLEIFRKHGDLSDGKADSPDKGHLRGGNSEEN